MNLLQTKRLVRKITELLAGNGDEALGPKLAEDFAAACRAAALRLGQCEAMIAAGDRSQALQLAETPPHLLDVVTVLEFRDAPAWRNFCRQQGWPPPETLDERAVAALNDCYAHGISGDDPLYRDYRRAMVLKNDAAALQALRTITRLNPSDGNAATELTRLDRKVLSAELERLNQLMREAGVAEIAAAVQAIETAGYINSPLGEIWTRAQAVRCGVVLESIARLKELNDWRSALDQLDVIHALRRETGFTWNPEREAQFAALSQWAEAERSRDEKDREFASLLNELRHLVQTSEDKEISARELTLAEFKHDLAAMQKTWRAIEAFAQPVPDELTARFRKRAALLQAEVSRRQRVRLQAIAAIVLVALVVFGGAGWWFLGSLRAREFVSQLADAREKRLVRTTEKLLSQARAAKPGWLSSTPAVSAAAASETFLQKEQALLAGFVSELRSLPETLDTLRTGDQLQALQSRFNTITNLLAQLAPDLRAENEPTVAKFANGWVKHVIQLTAELNKNFEQKIQAAETTAAKLDFAEPIPAVRKAFELTTLALAQVNEQEQGFRNSINWRPELRQRASDLRSRHGAFASELQTFDAASRDLASAADLSAYKKAIGVLSRSQFTTDPLVRTAAAVNEQPFTEENFLRSALCGTNAALWSYLQTYSDSTFVPKAVMPVEKRLFLQLKSEEAISSEHYRYTLALDRDRTRLLHWITVGKLHTQDNLWQPMSVYDLTADDRRCVFKPVEVGYFNKSYLAGQQRVVEVQPQGACTEASAFFDLGIPNLVSLREDTFGFPLLKTLDELKRSKRGSSVFRAYLFLKLCELMDSQSEAWGAPFAPALPHLRGQLAAAGAGEVTSGDWFVRERLARLTDPLQKIFDASANVSFWEQARAVAGVYRAAMTNGVAYAGHVDAEGKARVASATATELWGWTKDARATAILFRKSSTGWESVAAAIPGEPLFTFNTAPGIILASAGVKTTDAVITAGLPMMFRK